jgi:hypothetical protein
MDIELDIIENVSKEDVKIFCEKIIKGGFSDQEWRDYQLNSILTNSNPLEMNGYKIHKDDSITYVFDMLYGCIECDDITTPIVGISHAINKVHIGDTIKVSIKPLNTPQGKVIQSLIDSGYNIKVLPKVFILSGLPNRRQIFRLDIQ